MKQSVEYDVLGVGAPIMDYLLQVPYSFLLSVPGPKHGMALIDSAAFEQLIANSKQVPKQLTGGSCANTLEGLANLGRRCALQGGIGRDFTGERFLMQMTLQGIDAYLVKSDHPTTQVLCFVTPDGKRTFRRLQGASAFFGPEQLDTSLFCRTQLLHLEGYALLNPGLMESCMQLAKEAGALISLDLASHELVQEHRKSLLELIPRYVDIVFCNEDEARSLEQTAPERACDLLRQLCPIAVILQGRLGCLVGDKESICHYPAYPITPVDTTGAGDFFASGFLHGYLNGRPLSECARYGALMGNAVVQVIGAKIPEKQWPKLRQMLTR